ncbi:unnamed protein product [Linum trigynum]
MAVCFIALPVLVILIPGIHQESPISDVLGRLYKLHPVGEGAAYNNSNAHHLVDDPQPVGQGVALNESNAHNLSDEQPGGQGVAHSNSNAHHPVDDPHPVGQGVALNESNAHLVDDPHAVGQGVALNESNAHNLSDVPHPVGQGVAHNDSNEHNLSDDGLFAPGFDEKSCLSRFQHRLYRKSERKPSAYLLSKLRSYEHLHRRCGLYTDPYNRTLTVIRSGEDVDDTTTGSITACKYLIWHPVNGLGNRMISLASTFLYALLTDRVLLADLTQDMADLFCEPFLGSPWILPLEFPLRNLARNGKLRFAHSAGKALKNSTLKVTPPDSPAKAPPFLFINLYQGKYADEPSSFYCDESQSFLRRVPCLSLLSDQYFVPSLFLIKSFKKEAIRLFPEKEAVYHHLVHYLMLPSNQAWELITRFYEANLAKADERIGLQVRVFEEQFIPILTDKILTCLQNQTHLPKIDNKKPKLSSSSSSPRNQTPTTTTTAVLITSLYPQFYQNLSTMYSNKQTVSGEVIKFYQPSHEGKQRFEDGEHNMKALVEIYLLSMCEKLVISADSTFGYAAQGLGANRAWILLRPGYGFRDSCVRDLSVEPCFQWPPPSRNCIGDRNNSGSSRHDDVTENVAYLKHCEDWKSGVKLVDVHEEL